MSRWTQEGAAVASGDLHPEPEVAQLCAQRCAEILDHLQKLQLEAKRLGKIDGFGDPLPSGVDLATNAECTASGGDCSMEQAITEHIKVVQEMQQTFEKNAAPEERGVDGAGAPL
ncbi:hypothetical protein [Rhodococcus sp. NPDC058514]|uniref:hypothetical protein n=1 Tax=unclassified Rhodococcus (in: high G+C Gram-positive bacteria) TaxID=192944 RepID=UPI0036667B53